jgi:phosphoribosylaminoimidazole carboxylase PurE protein
MTTAKVGMLMGSLSDKPVLEAAAGILNDFGVPFEWRVLSAHRTPAQTHEYVATAEARGIRVMICAAGMAAHLAGVTASGTIIPVLGVPVDASLDGMDALLATVQMPPGIPVATFGIGRAGAKNAALHAIQILALSNGDLRTALLEHRQAQAVKVLASSEELQKSLSGA